LGALCLTGFSDAESTFSASISKNNKSKLGWTIGLSYAIHLSIRDIRLLEQIKLFFNVGSIIHNPDKGLAIYRVRSLKDLAVIIKFFQKYSLLTSKRHNFNLFVVLYEIILKKEHLTVSGFLKSISIINNLNNPINSDLMDEITLK
jgi:LAGLIDADG endonuclease